MAPRLKYANPRVPTLPALLVLFLVLGGVFLYAYRSSTLYSRNSANAEAVGLALVMAEKLRAGDEATVRAATPESLRGADADRWGNIYGLELQGAAPTWHGTRLYATRDGRTVAWLTIASLQDGVWTTETERIPEWWRVWE
jgi:hypothetical protein